MEITYDPNKDVANRDKHGVSMALAANLAWDTAVTWPDERKANNREKALYAKISDAP